MDTDIWIGKTVTYQGRTYVVRGFDPMSLPQQTAELVDTETGMTSRVPVAHLGSATSRTSAGTDAGGS